MTRKTTRTPSHRSSSSSSSSWLLSCSSSVRFLVLPIALVLAMTASRSSALSSSPNPAASRAAATANDKAATTIAPSKTKSAGVWSESAIRQARELSKSQREKLLSEPGVRKEREVVIRAERLDPSRPGDWMREIPHDDDNDDDNDEWETYASKIVSFQRHGQGYHNLLGDVLRAAGITPSVDSNDPAINPWLRPEIVDSPLTELGKEQCKSQRELASGLSPEAVVVSPLLRAIQTAEISFAHVHPSRNNDDDDDGRASSSSSSSSSESSAGRIPWIAHEGIREETGVLVCNQRRPLSEIRADFPFLEWAGDDWIEEDSLFDPLERESSASRSDRIYDFLVHFLAERPEQELAVVGHSATLFHMCNAVLECPEDEHEDDDASSGLPPLTAWFLTSEIRSMRLTFRRRRQSPTGDAVSS